MNPMEQREARLDLQRQHAEYAEIVPDSLFLGSGRLASDEELLNELKITHILNVADDGLLVFAPILFFFDFFDCLLFLRTK